MVLQAAELGRVDFAVHLGCVVRVDHPATLRRHRVSQSISHFGRLAALPRLLNGLGHAIINELEAVLGLDRVRRYLEAFLQDHRRAMRMRGGQHQLLLWKVAQSFSQRPAEARLNAGTNHAQIARHQDRAIHAPLILANLDRHHVGLQRADDLLAVTHVVPAGERRAVGGRDVGCGRAHVELDRRIGRTNRDTTERQGASQNHRQHKRLRHDAPPGVRVLGEGERANIVVAGRRRLKKPIPLPKR